MSEDQPHNGDKNNNDDGQHHQSLPQEYRLVPVDDWPGANDKSEADRQVDIQALAHRTWQRRKFILRVTAVFVIIGLIIALFSAVEYQANATLLPESQNQLGSASGLLDQYGSLLGIGSSINLNQKGSFSPELYPDIVNSLPYQLEILNKRVNFSSYDTTVTNYEFFDKIYSPSLFGYLGEYTIGLPGKIAGLFSSKSLSKPLPRGFSTDSVINISKHQLNIVNSMRKRINLVLDDKTGLITISVEMPDANAAAEVGQLSVQLLKDYITDYRTQKALEDLEFTREQVLKAKEEFQHVQLKLADFQDSNFGQQTAKAQIQQQRLQSEYDLTFSKYNSLAQKEEQAKLRVQEKTPVVTVLKPIEIPVDNAKPKRRLIVILSLILGLFLSVGYIIVSELMQTQESESLHY